MRGVAEADSETTLSDLDADKGGRSDGIGVPDACPKSRTSEGLKKWEPEFHVVRINGKPRSRSQLFRQNCAKAGIRSLCESEATSLPSTNEETMPAVWRNRRDMTSKLTWILNLWKMSSHNKRNTTWELVVEQVSKFLRHTLPM